MITSDLIFDDFTNLLCAWVSADAAGADLAKVAEHAIADKMPLISVAPGALGTIWPWLEKEPVKIMARFYYTPPEMDISELARTINAAFKNGADGAQIFLSVKDLDGFVGDIKSIRDDLFFNRYLSVGIDIGEIAACDWERIFMSLREIRASSVIFALTRDAGDKSDFVGRIYGMLDAFDKKFTGDVHFVLGKNFERSNQTLRLIHKMQPGLANGARFFIG